MARNLATLNKLPQALAIQKKKLLIAINKPNDDAGISEEDEQLVKDVTEALRKIVNPLSTCTLSTQWTGTEATNCVNETLQEHTLFQLSEYLRCAEIVCENFKKKKLFSLDISIIDMEYLLTHARQFGNPIKNIFQLPASANQVTTSSVDSAHLVSQQTSQDSITKRAKQLIVELREGYDETKFQTLNAHTTSFVLLILRRLMKESSIISRSGVKSCKCLVIEAYLTTNDEKTKKNIYDSCVKYMEWHDMQLPGLFFKVVDLYGIEVGKLWDHLISISSRKTENSLNELASEYYNNYKLMKTNPLQNQQWFAYCRVFDDYHRNLSNKLNVCLCAILGHLIERKNMLQEPAYKYKCPDNADHVDEWAKKVAADLFNKMNK